MFHFISTAQILQDSKKKKEKKEKEKNKGLGWDSKVLVLRMF